MAVALLIMVLLVLNGIGAFVYALYSAPDTAGVWAMLAVTYVYYLGITQAGIIFAAIMRIAKSDWGRFYSRLGEIITLSFIPVAVVLFIILAAGGSSHLFWWWEAGHSPQAGAHGHVSPWLNSSFFVWRTVIINAAFYLLSYAYFRSTRAEERGAASHKGLNILACVVMFLFVFANTNTAWDYGMMIIPHWESTVYPGYFWAGNLFAGFAFLFLMSLVFIRGHEGEKLDPEYLDSIGKLLLGFTMLWVYLFWAGHIVITYSDLPNLTAPLEKMSSGPYATAFVVMIFTLFIIPFLALIFRKVKLCVVSLAAVSIIICLGLWINRYLQVVPVFADGSLSVPTTYAGVSLLFAGLSLTILSIFVFRRVFPAVPVSTELRKID